MTVDIPVLETERLTLRGHRAGDLDDSLAMWSDPQVTLHITGKPFNREEVWARLLRYLGHWQVMGYGLWAVSERATGRFIGEVGLADFKRELPISFGGAPEAGWVLAPPAHGQGYATEAMSAVLAWADEQFARTVCIISPPNAASLRVAAKLGYREFARTDYRGVEVIALERDRRLRRG